MFAAGENFSISNAISSRFVVFFTGVFSVSCGWHDVTKRERRNAKAGNTHVVQLGSAEIVRIAGGERTPDCGRFRSGYFRPAEAAEVDPRFVVAIVVIIMALLSSASGGSPRRR
jgi:hypothetical protein